MYDVALKSTIMSNTNSSKIQYINSGEGNTLVSQFLNTLPIGILNKKRTGCGATSVVLENHEDVIVCCPTVQLINNKVAQYPNERCSYILFGVIAGISKEQIKDYIVKCREEYNQPVKIMVTYNSFGKVKEAVEDKIFNYKIIVDEYQELLASCVYREKAIFDLLRELNPLNKTNVTYLSATPIPIDYRPDELSELKEYEIIWENGELIRPHRYKTNKPIAYIINIIQSHKQGVSLEIEGCRVEEYFFFINSVKSIKSVIDTVGLTNDEVKVVCADNAENRKKLGNVPISDLSSSNKTFTFCTKTVFCGADIYSDAGLAIIVSSGNNKSTMLDIATDIQQIAGRIRTSTNPFKNIVLHIFNTGISCQTQAEFDNWLSERIDSAQNYINAYNRAISEAEKNSFIERLKMDDKYELAQYDKNTNAIKLNYLKINHFKYNFKSIDKVYRNGLGIRDAYLRAGCDLSIAQRWEESVRDYVSNMNGIPRFELLYEEYLEEKERAKNFGGVTDRSIEIESLNSLVKHAYQYLTPEKVRALRYNSTDIRNEVYFELPDTQIALKEALREHFSEGGEYTNADAKALYKETLERLQIKRNAKAQELKDRYFNVETKKIVINGQRKNGFKIATVLLAFGLSIKEESNFRKLNLLRKLKDKFMSIFSGK